MSVKTVSRVVNHVPSVQQDLVDRVLAAVQELGFQRNDIARRLRSGQTSATIGLLIEDLANPFYSTIASAAAEVAAAHETLLITASSEEDPARERQLLQELCQRRVDGLLVVPTGADHGFLRPEIELGTPAVFLDRPPVGLVADTLLLDNRGGSRAGVELLLAGGHDRIGILLDSPGVYTARERFAGVRAALAGAGVADEDRLARHDLHEPAAAAQAVAELLDQPAPPSAFFCGNNRITVGAVQELWRRGSDAAVVGFDDFELSHLVPRPLTVISYDTRDLGRQAAELLFRRIGGDSSWPATTILPTQLIERGTATP